MSGTVRVDSLAAPARAVRVVAAVPALALLIWLVALLGERSAVVAAGPGAVSSATATGIAAALLAAFAALLATARALGAGASRAREPVVDLLAFVLPWAAVLDGVAAVAPALGRAAVAPALETVGRTFLALALFAAAFAARGVAEDGDGDRWPRPTALATAALGTAALALAGLILGGVIAFPQPRFDTFLARPWDLPALALFAAGGLSAFPRLARRQPGLLGPALVLATIPFILDRLQVVGGRGEAGGATLAWLLHLLGYATLLTALGIELFARERRQLDRTFEIETAQRALDEQTAELQRVDRELVVQESKRRDAERSVRMLEKAVATMSMGVTISDPNGVILYVNPAGAAMHGFEASELIGSDLARLSPEGDRVPAPDAGLEAGGPWIREAEHQRREGEAFPVQLVSDAVRDEEGRVLAVVTSCEDITQRRQIEQMKHDFISTVSHELRTPLTSIIASLGLLDAGIVGGPDARDDDGAHTQVGDLIAVAHRNSKRLLQLINDLLDLQRLSADKLSLELRPVALDEVLEETLSGIRALAGKNEIGLELTALEPGLAVRADRRRLIQVLLNLISNAIKFSPAGERVAVAARRVGERVVISVTDRGPGIPNAYRQRVFDRFTQIDASATRRSGGSGLGLTIARELVEAMDGTIALDSETGHGTTFYVDLPRHPVAVTDSQPRADRGRI